jgi:hypothetical protein
MKRFTAPLLAALAFSAATLSAQVAPRVAPGDDPAFLKSAAARIDQQIAAFYKKKGLPVPDVTDDATFLRRAFLVSLGRIPTAEEAMAFLEIQDSSKREALVTYLLKSPGYSSHMTNWAFDLLRMTDGRIGTTASNEPYRHWVRTAIDKNMPWDEFVTRLVASSGDGWDPETASVGYYTRDRGMPLDNVANTMRIFLGSRMECAQCHDDPFGSMDRIDFYGLAAFTHGQGTVGKDLMNRLWREVQDSSPNNNSQEYRVAQILWDRVYDLTLGGGGTGNIKLPSDYQYRDGKPGEVIGAKTPFGTSARMSPRREQDNGRQVFADWITNKTGPQFPTVIANRMWARIMGKGIYEPVDDYIPAEKTHHPDLLNVIASIMHEVRYDLKAFQHILLLTRTFQFGTNPNSSIVDGGDDFHGRKIQRLSAEQIWDSLITLAGGNPDNKPGRTLDDRVYLGGTPVLVGKKTMPQISREVLALKTEAEVRAYYEALLKEVSGGNYTGGGESEGGDSMMMNTVRTFNRDAQVRASELPSPAPREHFLFLFGQSDREVVEASSREPNVGQVLSLMNGFVQRQLVGNSSAHLYQSLEGASTAPEKIRRLYIAILARPPSTDEMNWMMEEVQARGEEGYRNIVAALVMSSEFLFLQ